MLLRTIVCDIPGCYNQSTERGPNDGFPGWGHIGGVELNGVETPNVCPACLAQLMEFVDSGATLRRDA